jgi:hypothetical protein
MDDIWRLMKEGTIRPRVYRVGDVQTADPFAQTGLSAPERKKVLFRTFGWPMGIWRYVHRGCAERFRQGVSARGQEIFMPRTYQSTPQELIGRFRDVGRCDECGDEFKLSDEGYLVYWVVECEDHRLWQEVQAEQQPGNET